MKIIKEKAYEFLNNYIEQKLLSSSYAISDALTKDQSVNISGQIFVLNCWEENNDSGRVVCAEVSRKRMCFLSEAYSLGVLFSDGTWRKVDQEELWAMGF